MATNRGYDDPYEPNTRSRSSYEPSRTGARVPQPYESASRTRMPTDGGYESYSPRARMADDAYSTGSARANAQAMSRSMTSSSRRRKKKRKNRTLLFSLAILGVLGAAVLIYQFAFQKSASIMSMTATPISTASTYLNTGDGLLYQTDGKIHFYHLTDEKKNYTYGMGASDIRMSGSESMTAVFNAASVQVVGKKDPIPVTGTIHEVECGTNYIAALHTDTDGIDKLRIMTPDGEALDDRDFSGQYIVDFGIYKKKAEMLWIETLSVNASVPSTTISIYDTTKERTDASGASAMGDITGVMNVQDQLVDEVYITSNSIFVAATNQIIRYTHEGNKEIYRTTVYGYQVADFSNASAAPTFLLTPRGGDFHSVKLLTVQEDAAASPVETYLQLPGEGVAAYIMGNRLVVASREKVFTYSLTGKLVSEATFEQPVDSAVKLTDTTLMLSSNGTYYLAVVK